MNSKTKKVFLLSLLGIMIFILFSSSQIYYTLVSIADGEQRAVLPRGGALKSSSYWESTTPIYIDDMGVNN